MADRVKTMKGSAIREMFKRMADPATAAPYAATCLGMIDGFDAAAGFPDADGNPTVEQTPML